MNKPLIAILCSIGGFLLFQGRHWLREEGRRLKQEREEEFVRQSRLSPQEYAKERLARDLNLPSEPAPGPEHQDEQREPEELQPLVRWTIGERLAQGLMGDEEIVQEALVVGRVRDGGPGEALVRQLVKDALLRQARVEKEWPAVTDFDRLANAYQALRRRRFVVLESCETNWNWLIMREEKLALDARGRGEVAGAIFQADLSVILDRILHPQDTDEDLELSSRIGEISLPVWYGVFGEDESGARAKAVREVLESELRRAGLKVVPAPEDADPSDLLGLPPRHEVGNPTLGESIPVAFAEEPIWVRVKWQRRRQGAALQNESGTPDYVLRALGRR